MKNTERVFIWVLIGLLLISSIGGGLLIYNQSERIDALEGQMEIVAEITSAQIGVNSNQIEVNTNVQEVLNAQIDVLGDLIDLVATHISNHRYR